MPFGLVSAWNKRRRSKSQDHTDPWIYKPVECWQIEDQITSRPTKKRYGSSVFTLKEMEEATCCFSEDNFLGKGGFGRVYKGNLRSGEVVAIKKMELPRFREAEGEREFRVEVDILSRLDHPNLVSLIGYCADGKQRFLVYEYMQKGNLQDHLNGIGESKIDWPSRLKVALGAARGLAYLHSSSACGIPIVHRDFKSTNVLLNANFEAKISDFGLAKLMPEGHDIYVTARVLGTFGYFDPEYTSTGKLTLRSDVYAFGVVLLELLTGRRAVDINQGPNDQNLVLQVDGMDALAVKQACKFAKKHALKNGPIILEMDTYRYHGHSMSDPGSTYRTRDEISGIRQERDPIERIRKLIFSHDLATEKELKDIEKELRKEVDNAIAQAKESPMPESSELFTNVYAKGFGTESFGADRKEVRATLP